MTRPQTQLRGDQGNFSGVFPHPSITPEVISRLDSFFEFMTPHDLRENLMLMYHSYIQHEHDALPDDFSRVAEAMIMFFDVLKVAGDEFRDVNGWNPDKWERSGE